MKKKEPMEPFHENDGSNFRAVLRLEGLIGICHKKKNIWMWAALEGSWWEKVLAGCMDKRKVQEQHKEPGQKVQKGRES